MRLILAVSADDYLARGPEDDMSWTGRDDKAVFRLMTSVGGTYGAGSRTFDQMPQLPGRKGIRLSRGPSVAFGDHQGPSMTLGRFAHVHPDGWLLGGPTVALEALETNMVDQVYLCRSPAVLKSGMPDTITPWLMSRGELQNAGAPWQRSQRIRFGDVTVDVWSCMTCQTAIESPRSGVGSKII